MNILAQHGFSTGDKILNGLNQNLIDGVIYSAKDIAPARLIEKCDEYAEEHPESLRLFDPQLYAALFATGLGVRLGHLSGGTPHPYFSTRTRRQFERETQIDQDIRACLSYQIGLSLTGMIAPNIVIRSSLDSVEASIAKTFLRRARVVYDELGDSRPLYITLSMSIDALRDRIHLQNFLQEVTELESPPDGFYVLIEHPSSDVPPTLDEPGVLSRWMLVNHILVQSGFEVINGYADALAPYLGAAGGIGAASGWFNTLKIFSLKKFAPATPGGSQPVPRYSSRHLMKSIRYTELEALRLIYPEILNQRPTDDAYDPDEGSRPSNMGEVLQNWDFLKQVGELVEEGDIDTSLDQIRNALDAAQETYDQIGAQGITLRERSNGDHIEAVKTELDVFSTLAEL